MKKISKPVLELSNICRADKKANIDRISLSIPEGESCAVLCGNEANISLLLDIVSGKVSPKKGKVFFKGDDVTGVKNCFGIVPRKPSPPKFKTVGEYAAAPVVKRGLSKAMTSVLVKKEIAVFGLEDCLEENVSRLPPDKAAVAALFAAYMCSHELIVLDEPFYGLDGDAKEAGVKLLENLQRGSSTSLLIFTEDADLAVRLCTYVMAADDHMQSKGMIAVDRRRMDKTKERLKELVEK